MAEQPLQEKTEKATPKRLADSRKKGQVARSKELNTMAITLAAALLMLVLGRRMLGDVSQLLAQGLSLPRAVLVDSSLLFRPLLDAVGLAVQLVTPFFLLLSIVAMVAPLALGGWSFSASAMAFKGERINPLAGLKRIFALRGLMELVKALAKFGLVGAVCVLVLRQMAPEIMQLGTASIEEGLQGSGELVIWAFFLFSSALVIIAMIDVPFQAWDHAQKLRMTKQEVREENKDVEGRPEVKSRLRGMQQEVANRRMLEDIPIASVVITNPTHYAVALKYETGQDGAPEVVAKGADFMAARIRELATEHGVPLFEAPPLARALYAGAEVGDQIPEELYVGVAQILTYIYQLDRYLAQGGGEPERPTIEIDEEEFGL